MGRYADCLDARRSTFAGRIVARNRLVEQIFRAFEQACDLEELELARGLLAAVETFVAGGVTKMDGAEQPYADQLIQAHFRLLEMRYHH